jgi:hypothetical protein
MACLHAIASVVNDFAAPMLQLQIVKCCNIVLTLCLPAELAASFQVIHWGFQSACACSRLLAAAAASWTRKGWCPRRSCNWPYCFQHVHPVAQYSGCGQTCLRAQFCMRGPETLLLLLASLIGFSAVAFYIYHHQWHWHVNQLCWFACSLHLQGHRCVSPRIQFLHSKDTVTFGGCTPASGTHQTNARVSFQPQRWDRRYRYQALLSSAPHWDTSFAFECTDRCILRMMLCHAAWHWTGLLACHPLGAPVVVPPPPRVKLLHFKWACLLLVCTACINAALTRLQKFGDGPVPGSTATR